MGNLNCEKLTCNDLDCNKCKKILCHCPTTIILDNNNVVNVSEIEKNDDENQNQNVINSRTLKLIDQEINENNLSFNKDKYKKLNSSICGNTSFKMSETKVNRKINSDIFGLYNENIKTDNNKIMVNNDLFEIQRRSILSYNNRTNTLNSNNYHSFTSIIERTKKLAIDSRGKLKVCGTNEIFTDKSKEVKPLLSQ